MYSNVYLALTRLHDSIYRYTLCAQAIFICLMFYNNSLWLCVLCNISQLICEVFVRCTSKMLLYDWINSINLLIMINSSKLKALHENVFMKKSFAFLISSGYIDSGYYICIILPENIVPLQIGMILKYFFDFFNYQT